MEKLERNRANGDRFDEIGGDASAKRLIIKMQGKTGGFGGVHDRLNEVLRLIGLDKPFLDITTTRSVIFEANGGGKTPLKPSIDGDEVAEGVRQMAEVEGVALGGSLALIKEAGVGDLLDGFAIVPLIAVEVFGEKAVG